jgi:hypothetical protein
MEIHGLKATKMGSPPEKHGLRITVRDGIELVVLDSGGGYLAGLTAPEARYLAAVLIAAALRLEERS